MSFIAKNGNVLATVTALADVKELEVRQQETLWFSFLVGVANLTQFVVQYRLSGDGDWFTVASASADYTVPNGPVLGASADLSTAAFGSTVYWIKLDVKGVHSVRIRAAGTASTVTGDFGAQ